MAKTQKTSSAAPSAIGVRYDLLDLSTAQHKAGLAGLLLQVESMRARELPADSVPNVELIGPTSVEATFTEVSLRGLFDDLYDAETAFAESPTRWPGATPVEEKEKPDLKTGKPKKVFVYEVVQPRGYFLRQFTDDGKEAWHKLWRDMLWTIPRGRPTTRGPFNSRAASPKRSSGEGEVAWSELLAAERARGKNELRTCEVAGAILLGAQALSAESVPFRDRAEHALLLHFWQLTVRVFVPEQIDADGAREFVGYVLAVPEVADLRKFLRLYKASLAKLDPKLSGYRPASAVISLPAQGALEFMDGLSRIAGEATSADRSEVARSLAGVEFFHMVKAGNNVKTMTGGRLAAREDLLQAYEGIKAACRNPLFLSGRLLALLRGGDWYGEFGRMMAERDWPLFVGSERTPRNVPSFAWDVLQRFRSTLQNEEMRKANPVTNTSTSQPASLETLIYRLVRRYVRAKTDDKSPIKYDTFKDKKIKTAKGRERVDYPRVYTEAQEKVCSDLFLGMRSRRDDDFVSYFSGTVLSVAQGPTLSGEDDFHVVARALLDEEGRRNVKTLAMLAIAASSYASTGRADDEDHTDDKKEATQ
jgi:CRISPR-associated protein Cmx8